MEILKWIENWFATQCDGDWEHENQIKIYTTSNPGWLIEIDLSYTGLEMIVQDDPIIENDENDWYGEAIKNGLYRAFGDLSKLEFLLNKFREFVEVNQKSSI